jgi:hypothetical protein
MDAPIKNDTDSDYKSGGSGNGSPADHEWSPECFMNNQPADFDDFTLADLLDDTSDLGFQLPPPTSMAVKEEPNFTESENNLAMVPAAVDGLSRSNNFAKPAPAHGDVVCLQYLEYEWGYCKVRKVSTSTGGDGRVRIRCECGGKHSDGQPRMHAKWKLCRQLSRRDEMLKLESSGPSQGMSLSDAFQDSEQPWKRAKTMAF